MSPTLALCLWLVLLLALLRFDPARVRPTSLALWVPVTWIFIVASRLPSQWLGFSPSSNALTEGNPVDRITSSLLILLAVCILFSRSFRWGNFTAQNIALLALILFGLVSVVWSDFPFVAFKRWVRDLGHYLAVLVVLTDSNPLEAVRTVLRRLAYLLLPLSLLLIKYFPNIGMDYSSWTGAAMYVGPTTGKNSLGAICMIGGLFFFWDVVTRWSDRKDRRTKRIIVVDFLFLAMALWLVRKANSATALVCLAIGCVVVVAVHSGWGQRHPVLLRVSFFLMFPMYLLLAYGMNLNAYFAGSVGRDPSLTERTYIWKIVLDMHTNPLVGTGYESFWLGPRLDQLWAQSVTYGINEAHNGWLEIYLNLGSIGVVLMCIVLIASYRKIAKKLVPLSALSSLMLALWIITLFYNMTEAAFKWHFMWLIFLMAAVAVPESVKEETPSRNLARRTVGQSALNRSQEGARA